MEEPTEVKTESAMPARAGRKRTRPIEDWKAVAKQQAETIKTMQAQMERMMGMFTATAQSGANPLAQFLPPKPTPVARPEGYLYMLSHIPEHENDDSDKLSTFLKRVPSRPDNPEEPDPRYCPYCQQDVTKLAGHRNIPGDPTPDQQAIIEQCMISHMQRAEALSGSKRKGKEGKADREFAANHLQMKYTKFGRVPDEVAWLYGKSWTAEEWNERELKLWEAKCRSVGLGMAQGGA